MYQYLTLPNLILWIVVNSLPAWITIYMVRNHWLVDKATREKYSAFVRTDLDKIAYLRCIVLYFFYWPRMILVGSLMAIWTLLLIPLMIGAPTDRPVERWRYRLITALS